MARQFGRAGTLGEGSFGRVEQVVDVETGQLFAAKVFLDSEDNYLSVETLTELQFLHCLGKHPNIVALETVIFHLDGIPGFPVAVLGLCQRDLEKALTWLTGPQRMQVLAGLWKGLAYLHSPHTCALLHRDIKAGNVLLDFEEGPTPQVHARLCDFSFAAWFPKDTSTNQLRAPAEGPLGTTGYIAPELFEDQPFTPAADVWAAAVVSLEVLLGQTFECARDKAAFRQLFAMRDKLGQRNPWAVLLRKLLQEDPLVRPSAAQILEEFPGGAFPQEEKTPADPTEALQQGLKHWREAMPLQQKQRIGKGLAFLQAPPVAEAYLGLLTLRFPEACVLTRLILTVQLAMGETPDAADLYHLASLLHCGVPRPNELLSVVASCKGDLLGLSS
ncbi:hypothetical protein EBZ37_07870 [bacterium]|nr:hypothetical protein [bacterium]